MSCEWAKKERTIKAGEVETGVWVGVYVCRQETTTSVRVRQRWVWRVREIQCFIRRTGANRIGQLDRLVGKELKRISCKEQWFEK